jgi:hypothetical protein
MPQDQLQTSMAFLGLLKSYLEKWSGTNFVRNTQCSKLWTQRRRGFGLLWPKFRCTVLHCIWQYYSLWLLIMLHTWLCQENQTTNSTEQSQSVADSRSAGQKIPRRLWNPKDHSCVQRSLPLDCILSRMNPVRILLSYSPKVLSTPHGSWKWSTFFGFSSYKSARRGNYSFSNLWWYGNQSRSFTKINNTASLGIIIRSLKGPVSSLRNPLPSPSPSDVCLKLPTGPEPSLSLSLIPCPWLAHSLSPPFLQTQHFPASPLQPWWWRQRVSPKRWYLWTSLHGAKTQKNIILTTMRTSNLTIFF